MWAPFNKLAEPPQPYKNANNFSVVGLIPLVINPFLAIFAFLMAKARAKTLSHKIDLKLLGLPCRLH